jgi:hypothetical protein
LEADLILSIEFLGRSGFSSGNTAAFFSSFAIFSLSAFSPLFIQGVLGRSPAQMGVGISGSLLNARFIGTLSESGLGDSLPPCIGEQIRQNIEQIFRPDIQSLIPVDAIMILQETVGRGVSMVFWASTAASMLCLIFCLRLPRRTGTSLNSLT